MNTDEPFVSLASVEMDLQNMKIKKNCKEWPDITFVSNKDKCTFSVLDCEKEIIKAEK